MAKARRVRGIRPKRSLRENGALVIETRLEEFLSWREALDDPSKVTDLHNMRIAAKRLRYALEILEDCFDDAKQLAKEVTGVQEALGDIHDLDVLADLLRARLRALDTPLEEQAISIAGSHASRADRSNRLRQALYAQSRDRRRLGLLGLLGEKVHERQEKYAAFNKEWNSATLDEFEQRVRKVLIPESGLRNHHPVDQGFEVVE